MAWVAFSTLGSRVLGLVRDVLFFASFGAGAVSSAFIFAFTVPNLFRRLLGEGALTSAFVPVSASALERGGRPEAFQLLDKVLSRLAVVLLVLVGLGMAGFAIAGVWEGLPERWALGGELGAYLMPYLGLICVAALLAALLQVFQRFAVAALTGVWLNLTMIAALAVGTYWAEARMRVYLLCGGVLVGGLLQVAVPLMALRREGWRYRPDWQSSPETRECWQLLLPGMIGASVFQINIVISRLLAFSLNETAVSVLYLANRLVELPLGVFAIAVTTVIFPRLARLFARGEEAGMGQVYAEGLRLILAITVPAALGLILLREPILIFLMEWGAFGRQDVGLTIPVLAVFALALPWYALATYETRGFHALKDTRSPVRVAVVVFVVNTLLALLLMYPLGAVGLAWASVISTVLQVGLLHGLLVRRHKAFSAKGMRRTLMQIALAALAMGMLVGGGWEALRACAWTLKTQAAVVVLGLIPLSMGIYFAVLWKAGFHELALLRDLVRRRLSRESI